MGSLEIERVDPARKPMPEGYAGVFVVDDVGGIAAVEHPEDRGPTGDHAVPTPRRAKCAACALATHVLVGLQPVFTHVPPIGLRSTTTTV
jgi:hypothetical protein